MLLADNIPNTPPSLVGMILAVVNILMLALVLIAKYVFYKWLYKAYKEEQSRGEKVERLLVASERILALAGERMERVADTAQEVKKGIHEMPEKTANKVVEKISTSESSIVRNPLN